MRGFHIDMNTAQFKGDYLKKWLKELAKLGYDTIIWEIEANVKWDTCPECSPADAMSKTEFKELLKLSAKLGMENIPLFQTLAHCEYVLKHDKYKNLMELQGEISQYCPQNPEVLKFTGKWIDEYLELFGKIKYFHIGADEARFLGKCGKCREYVEEKSVSQLYIDYVNKVSEPLIKNKIIPIIWADMALSHPEALEKLSRKIMLFDWIYSVRRIDGEVQVWGETNGKHGRNDIPKHISDLYKKYLYPNGFEYGRVPETFYTADYLADKGFKVVTCPGSSSYGDNVFSPRNWYHMTNTFDSFQKGMSKHLFGSVLTSWTIHLFPWELQLSCIEIPSFLKKYPKKNIEEFQKYFVNKHFGLKDDNLWKACGLLSIESLFAYTDSLGFDKSLMKVPESYVIDKLKKISEEGRTGQELENSEIRLKEYKEALKLFEKLEKNAKKGKDLIKIWKLFARNLINRAEAAIFLLKNGTGTKKDGQKILKELHKLKIETEEFYKNEIIPSRLKDYMHWMYGSIEYTLNRSLGE
ncbi:MAG: hypothetical protein A3J83_03700 [Elusimicrobia bacterium RIFOXYA2_FULL_40_6]|nr:MAG: hypothetical protein A3J83_03700 [Elusimicrobia bacterium RIFOXYA2_FULL_40_6]